jgi:oligoribonuclease NrnB/cAMP/cGMP phosphodiesterase (DHH superfamily)
MGKLATYGDDISAGFHNDKTIPTFLKYIDDYDCWKGIYGDDTRKFHYGFKVSKPCSVVIRKLLNHDHKADFRIIEYIKNGEVIMEHNKFEDKNYHVDMYGFEFTLPEEHGGLKCFCLNRKGNSLMFGEKIDEYDAVIPFYFNNGKWTYSIYSKKENIDCSEIAKTYGGGGHKGAAGWVGKFIFA